MEYKMIGVVFIILYTHQLAAEPKCPTNICSCQPSSTKGIKNNYYNKAICTAFPQTSLPQSFISIKVVTNVLNVTSQTLEHVQNVSTLDISRCNISGIEEDALVSMKRLTVLRLSYNKLKSLPQQLFEPLIQLLKDIYLDNNELETIKDEFKNLRNLETLSLHHNRLVCFPDNLPGSLIYLNVSYNNITPTVPANSSQFQIKFPLFSGETLDLYGNRIEHILSWSWINMTNIKLLRLGNYVSTIPLISKDVSVNLTTFTLSARNCNVAAPMDGVTGTMLKKMSKLTSLTLEYYDLDNCDFLEPMKELNKLVLRHVDLNNKHLHTLYIQHVFARLTKLEHLDLEGSPTFTNVILDHMKELPFDKSLNFLSLKNNHLKELHLNQMPETFISNSNFLLDLRENMLPCDNSLCWIFHSNLNKTNLVSPEHTMCVKNMIHNHHAVVNLLETEQDCLLSDVSSHTEITINKDSENSPMPHTENENNLGIKIMIILVILVVCFTLACIYYSRVKSHVFLSFIDPHPSIRLQEIDQSQEDLTQEHVKE